jgi:hypothetical protein
LEAEQPAGSKMSDFERWEKRYGAPGYLFGTAPNAFHAAQADRLRGRKTALSVADGEGRNGAWLAEQGLEVLAVDSSSTKAPGTSPPRSTLSPSGSRAAVTPRGPP